VPRAYVKVRLSAPPTDLPFLLMLLLFSSEFAQNKLSAQRPNVKARFSVPPTENLPF